jgi:hypothetical protein
MSRRGVFLVGVVLCLPTLAPAQTSTGPNRAQQEKIQQKYQKSLKKQEHKREKQEAKNLKAFKKQHPQ